MHPICRCVSKIVGLNPLFYRLVNNSIKLRVFLLTDLLKMETKLKPGHLVGTDLSNYTFI